MALIPRVFVASSSSAKPLALAISKKLKNAQVKVWSQGIFQPGETIIDGLNRNLRMFDFGVFVFAPDDKAEVDGVTQAVARDNVVFELGMFMAKLGKERSIIVRPKGVEMRLPTDTVEVITTYYDSNSAKHSPGKAVAHACKEISSVIEVRHKRARREMSTRMTHALETICCLMSAPGTPKQLGLRAFIFEYEESLDKLVCHSFFDSSKAKEKVGETSFPMRLVRGGSVAVVRAFDADGVKGQLVKRLRKRDVKPSLKYVLAAPIHNEDGAKWGVVDFDASNDDGVKLLQAEESPHIIWKLAEYLSTVVAC